MPLFECAKAEFDALDLAAATVVNAKTVYGTVIGYKIGGKTAASVETQPGRTIYRREKTAEQVRDDMREQARVQNAARAKP